MAAGNDEPIVRAEDDVLGRSRFASAIANELVRMDLGNGAVVGILGRWGSGKTSLLNLIQNDIKKTDAFTIIQFNPWMFSGANQLVESFFTEMAAQLRLGPNKLETVANEIASYGEIVAPLQVLPVIGAWIERAGSAAEAVKQLAEKRAKSVTEQRQQIAEALSTQSQKILVVVDDVDRLSTSEIRDIFKLVRLTASFPNVLYLVAFDRERVESALEEDNLPGRDYLEKIIQLTYDIPAVPNVVLWRQLTAAIGESLEHVQNPGPFAQSRWEDVLVEVILPSIRTMRHVRRYVASLAGTVSSLDGRVSVVDVLGLEAIRVFLPDVFVALQHCQDALTTTSSTMTSSFGSDEVQRRHAASIAALLETAGENAKTVEAMIVRLFPAAVRHIPGNRYGGESSKTWLPEGRVAHREVLNYYLERVAGSGLQAFWHAEGAFNLLTQKDQLEAYFRAIDPGEWEDVISSLETYEETFPPEAAGPATTVLLGLLPDLPERRHGFFGFDSRLVVTRVILRLLRRLESPEEVEKVVRAVLPEASTISGKWELLNIVGHDEHVGHKLIDEAASRELAERLREDVRNANAAALATERRLLWLLDWTKQGFVSVGQSFVIPEDQALREALLKESVTETRSQGFTSRFVRTEKQLRWNVLCGLLGGEDAIRQTVDQSTVEDDQLLEEARNLARKYLTGWRPDEFSRGLNYVVDAPS